MVSATRSPILSIASAVTELLLPALSHPHPVLDELDAGPFEGVLQGVEVIGLWRRSRLEFDDGAERHDRDEARAAMARCRLGRGPLGIAQASYLQPHARRLAVDELDVPLFEDAPDRLEIGGLRREQACSKSMMTLRGTCAASASCICVMKAIPRAARHWRVSFEASPSPARRAGSRFAVSLPWQGAVPGSLAILVAIPSRTSAMRSRTGFPSRRLPGHRFGEHVRGLSRMSFSQPQPVLALRMHPGPASSSRSASSATRSLGFSGSGRASSIMPGMVCVVAAPFEEDHGRHGVDVLFLGVFWRLRDQPIFGAHPVCRCTSTSLPLTSIN